jgi:hypothetical protein
MMTEPLVNYFAIGSMMNPVILGNRHITPVQSQPAILQDLRFFAPIGFAEAVPRSGCCFHGVVHTVTTKDMEIMDNVEGYLYCRTFAQASLYNGEMIPVTVYCRKEEGQKEGLPQERYLDVMIEGARHFGVDEKHIQELQSAPKEPRPSPSDFLSFGPPPEDTVMTLDDVRPFDGKDGRPTYITVNGKVLEIIEKDPSRVGLTLTMRKKGNITFEEWIPKIIYDPKYGVPKTAEECSAEYSAYMEHMTVQRVGIEGARVVAKFKK